MKTPERNEFAEALNPEVQNLRAALFAWRQTVYNRHSINLYAAIGLKHRHDVCVSSFAARDPMLGGDHPGGLGGAHPGGLL
jgi:hypothetical protein